MDALTRAQVVRIVEAASSAPSADNIQPWRYRWDGAALEIRLDPVRARHVIDHRSHASFFTLGATLEALSIGASVERRSARAALSLERAPGEAWATVHFDGPAEPHELAPALRRRCTDRRSFRGGSLADPVFEAIRGEAARFPGCAVRYCDRYPRELVDYLVGADAYVWRNEAVYRDVIRWIRFTRREVEETRDGIPWGAFGVDLPEIGALRVGRTRLVQRLVPWLGLHVPMGIWVRRHVASSAAVACFTVRRPSPEALVDAGRLVLSAWVRLNACGYGVQSLGVQSLQIYNAATCGMPAGTPAHFEALFRGGLDVVARAFGLEAGELPAWMLRTGRSTRPPRNATTLRLPVERVLTFSDGAG
ncbi:MAG: hypothetical protein IT372_15360 [Polyangiaceae bacterium]|nr:hypothetical protein [Polyangiaceae bacterium]